MSPGLQMMLRGNLSLLILCTALSSTPLSIAIEIADLYQAEVLVQSREHEDRQEAFQRAMVKVIVKISGDRGFISDPEVEDLLDIAHTYVQQYKYRESGLSKTAYVLSVRFDGLSLEKALHEGGLPVWGKQRPSVLIWLAVQQGSQRFMVGTASASNTRKMVNKTATERGIPVIYPLLDLEDQRQVDVTDVLGRFYGPVLSASERYDADAVVVSTAVSYEDGEWRSRWRLYYGGQPQDWLFNGALLESVISEGMHTVATSLAKRLAVAGRIEQEQGLMLHVLGVNSMEQFAHIEHYLEGLDIIDDIRAYRIHADRVQFLIHMRGDPKDLVRIINLGNVLERYEVSTIANSLQSQQANLYYQLNP